MSLNNLLPKYILKSILTAVQLNIGQINYPEVLKAAKAVDIKHYFIEDESPDHATQIPVTIAYLKGARE